MRLTICLTYNDRRRRQDVLAIYRMPLGRVVAFGQSFNAEARSFSLWLCLDVPKKPLEFRIPNLGRRAIDQFFDHTRSIEGLDIIRTPLPQLQLAQQAQHQDRDSVIAELQSLCHTLETLVANDPRPTFSLRHALTRVRAELWLVNDHGHAVDESVVQLAKNVIEFNIHGSRG